MAEFSRPLHVRIAKILARMDAEFLASAQCYFGGGTQLVLSHGEFRESRDIDFLVSAQTGIRQVRETVTPTSLGRIFKEPITLTRDLISDRDAVRTYIVEDKAAEPIKFEIVYEGRIEVSGERDGMLGVPRLTSPVAVAEKLLANADRGLDKVFRSRDVIDLAFVCSDLDDDTFMAGYALAEKAYGKSIARDLGAVIRRLDVDVAYRRDCVKDLLITDTKKLKIGLARLRALRRLALGSPTPKAKPLLA